MQTCLYDLTQSYGLAVHTTGSEGNAMSRNLLHCGLGLACSQNRQLTKGNTMTNNEKQVDLREKPCRCGDTMGEVIGFKERSTDNKMVMYRVCWYCVECQAIEKAIGRETYVS